MDDTAPRYAWSRIEGEPPEWHRLFEAYLQAPSERLSDFHAKLDPDTRPALSTLYRRAAEYRWRARRAALDHHLTAARTEAAAEVVRDHGRLHAAAWGLALDWAVESILHARAAGEALAHKDALAFLQKAFEAQRLMAGESTVNLGVDLARASIPLENLDAIQALLDGEECATLPSDGTPENDD